MLEPATATAATLSPAGTLGAGPSAGSNRLTFGELEDAVMEGEAAAHLASAMLKRLWERLLAEGFEPAMPPEPVSPSYRADGSVLLLGSFDVTDPLTGAHFLLTHEMPLMQLAMTTVLSGHTWVHDFQEGAGSDGDGRRILLGTKYLLESFHDKELPPVETLNALCRALTAEPGSGELGMSQFMSEELSKVFMP